MVKEPALEQLRASQRGDVLTPADAANDASRQIFNTMIDRRPAIIARYDPTNFFHLNHNVTPRV